MPNSTNPTLNSDMDQDTYSFMHLESGISFVIVTFLVIRIYVT